MRHDHGHAHTHYHRGRTDQQIEDVVPADHVVEDMVEHLEQVYQVLVGRLTEAVQLTARNFEISGAITGEQIRKIRRAIDKERDRAQQQWTRRKWRAIARHHLDRSDLFQSARLSRIVEKKLGVIPQFENDPRRTDQRGEDPEKIKDEESDDMGGRLESGHAQMYAEAAGAIGAHLAENKSAVTSSRNAANATRQALRSPIRKARNRSEFVSRDGTGNGLARFDKSRMGQLGATHYFWRTVGDNRVRPSHAAAAGNRYPWSQAPALTGGHPQEPHQCRCGADPDMNTITPENFTHRKTGPIVRQPPQKSPRPNFPDDPPSGEVPKRKYDYDPDMPKERKKRHIQWHWVHGSKQKSSMLTKEAVARELDVDGQVYGNPNFDIPEEHIEDAREVVREMYKETQDKLDELDIDSVEVYRGLKDEVKTPGVVESWSRSPRVAEGFDGHEIEKKAVDAEDVFMFSGGADDIDGKGPNWKNGEFGEQYEWVILQ